MSNTITGKEYTGFEIAANAYAERVCNGEFPITYTREQVVKHTAGDYIAGASAFKNQVIAVLKENYEACKTLTPEDAARTAQEQVNETYEDLIAIFDTLTTQSESEDELWISVFMEIEHNKHLTYGEILRNKLKQSFTISRKQ